VILVVATTAIVVPALSWNRVLSTPQELREGGISVDGWRSGGRIPRVRGPARSVLAGGFELAIIPAGDYQGAHNTLLAVLVEQGIAAFGVRGAARCLLVDR
jgi:hypothetical protein